MPNNTLPPDLLHYLQSTLHSHVETIESLKGGVISDTSRITLENGNTYVLKACPEAKPDLYPKETDALLRLNLPGCPRVPRVVAYSASYLLLEDLGHAAPPTPAQWEAFGRQVGTLHTHHNARFGLDYDNYLGLTVQVNDWYVDGYEFFVRHRVMANIDQGGCMEILDRTDREKIAQLCDRLPELVPAQPASLSHGDLWQPNILATKWGDVAYVDPALHYGWAEADLSLTTIVQPFPEIFYDAYLEVNPLQPGWRERLEIYLIKEYLVTMAQFGNAYESVDNLRTLLDKYG